MSIVRLPPDVGDRKHAYVSVAVLLTIASVLLTLAVTVAVVRTVAG